MSVWSEAVGTVIIKRSSGYSLQEGLRSIYDEVKWHAKQTPFHTDEVKIEFTAYISLEGVAAARVFEEWRKQIRNADPEAWVEITAAIRF